MFEHRLGLALGRSVAEIRALPYPEFRAWQVYYALEPWGWHNEEFHAANLLAMLFNINRGKGKPRDAKEFMRNMEKALLDALKEQKDPLEGMSFEEQRAYMVQQIKKDFGIK